MAMHCASCCSLATGTAVVDELILQEGYEVCQSRELLFARNRWLMS